MKKSYSTPEIVVEQMESICSEPGLGFNTTSGTSSMSSKEAEPLFEDEEDDWDDALDY